MRTQVLAFDETDDEAVLAASYASKVRGFSVQQSRTLRWDTGSRRWHEQLRLQWGYTNKDIRYQEEIGGYDIIGGNRAFLSVALIGDERDSLTDPRKGVFWTATTELARRFLGSDVDYVRLYGQVFTYVPLPGGLVWAQGYRAGVVPGDDPFYLLENRFQAGGPTTVRGFRQNGLGPQLTEDEGLGGQGVLVLNQEIRFPIWKNLKGGVFWDAGNSWLWANEFSLATCATPWAAACGSCSRSARCGSSTASSSTAARTRTAATSSPAAASSSASATPSSCHCEELRPTALSFRGASARGPVIPRSFGPLPLSFRGASAASGDEESAGGRRRRGDCGFLGTRPIGVPRNDKGNTRCHSEELRPRRATRNPPAAGRRAGQPCGVAVVIVSRPCAWGPVSRRRRSQANRRPTKPSTENIHIPGV